MFLLFSVLSAHADQSCPELEKAWRSKYTVEFKVTWNLKGFKCPGGESTVAQALWDLEHLEFDANPDGYKPDFYEIVKARIDYFARDHANQKDLAYELDRTLTVCPKFYKDERWDRASTLVHEARHADPDDPRHVTCTKGPYKGEAGRCDQEFYNGDWKGSGFNADIVFLSWLARAKHNNGLTREVIDSDVNDLVPDRFNVISAEQIKRWRR